MIIDILKVLLVIIEIFLLLYQYEEAIKETP